jgi:hypothetical protein
MKFVSGEGAETKYPPSMAFCALSRASSPEIARDDCDEGSTTEKIAGQRNSEKLITYEGLARETTSF